MIIILAILAVTHASPLGLPSPPLISRNFFQPPRSCVDPDGCRSPWDIIRSCVITVFLCTWASVHPNIPSPDDQWPRIAVRRLGLMLATLIVPEVIIGWALRQRLAAVRLAQEHKKAGWTTTHGFFAIMGGFIEYEGNRPIRVLLPEELQSYSLTGNGDFPKISKAEIEDKSKGDLISKTVVLLQTGWFAAQCIARFAQGLSITEMELITFGFAILNILVYAVWWHKPLNVQRGVRVYKQRITERPIDDGDAEVDRGHWDALVEALSELPATISIGPMTWTSTHPRAPWLHHVIVWPFLIPSQILGIGIEKQEYQDLKRVTTFYPDSWPTQRAMGGGLAFVLAITLALGFFRFLFIGFVAIIPFSWVFACIVPVTLSLSFVIRQLWERKYSHTPRLFKLILGLQLGLYMFYRLVLPVFLIVDAALLRIYGPDIYFVVHWASYIPHV